MILPLSIICARTVAEHEIPTADNRCPRELIELISWVKTVSFSTKRGSAARNMRLTDLPYQLQLYTEIFGIGAEDVHLLNKARIFDMCIMGRTDIMSWFIEHFNVNAHNPPPCRKMADISRFDTHDAFTMMKFIISRIGLISEVITFPASTLRTNLQIYNYIRVINWISECLDIDKEIITMNIGNAFYRTCNIGAFKLAQWIARGAKIKRTHVYSSLYVACVSGHIKIADWLVKEYQLGHDTVGVMENSGLLHRLYNDKSYDALWWYINVFNIKYSDISLRDWYILYYADMHFTNKMFTGRKIAASMV